MKRITAILLSCLITANITSSAFAIPVNENNDYTVYAKQYDSYAAVEHLKDIVDIDKLKNHILNGTSVCSTNIDISSFNIPFTSENANYLFELISNETPENFHLDDRLSFSYGGGKLLSLKPTYVYTASEYSEMLAELREAKDKLLTGIKGNNSLGDVEKALLIHDRLALLCEYDYNYTANRYTSYGALVDGAAVCQGYAVAYDYLLEDVGIESYYCASDTLNHGWNIVYISLTAQGSS